MAGIKVLRRSALAFGCAAGVAAAVAVPVSAAHQAHREYQERQAHQAPRAGEASRAAAAGTWRVVIAIRPATGARVFMSSVSAPAAGDVWAVGGTLTAPDQSYSVLEHWNGRTWKRVPVPGAGTPFFPYQVAASSAADVWVFGLDHGIASPRWAHWNGRSWTAGPLPVIKVAGDASPAVTITAAASAGPGGVWVAGTVADQDSKFGLPAQAFLASYDGHTWRVYPVPRSMPDVVGISALSRTDVWAAATGGQGTSGVGASTSDGNVLLHWNGRSWQSIPAPKNVSIAAVAGESVHSAWVAGSMPGKGPDHLTSVAGAGYWNGQRWTLVTDPAADAHFPQTGYVDQLTSAVPDGRGGLWAVAEPYPPLIGSLPGPASLWHYTKGRWTGTQPGDLDLFQLAEVPGTTSIWAAGTAVTTAAPGYPEDGLILRYQG